MSTFLICTIVTMLVCLALKKMYKDKKSGVVCGCRNCSGCSSKASCNTTLSRK